MRYRRLWPALVLGVALALLPSLTVHTPAQAGLPPRFTPTPTGAAVPAAGAALMLRVVFPAEWDFEVTPWYVPWTAVQWQDAEGDWHTVAGWQGHMDRVSVEVGTVTGWKTYWAGPENLGTGPFRWVIYSDAEGTLLAQSEPFMLPTTSDAWEMVEVQLASQTCAASSRVSIGTCCPPR